MIILCFTKTVSFLYSTIEVDDFTKRLFDIYETVHKEGLAQVNINLNFYLLSFEAEFI